MYCKLNYSFLSQTKEVRETNTVMNKKKQQITKKGSDADSGHDVSSEGDGYLDSREEDHRSDSSSSLDGEIF